jgi:hypothetical protein
MYLSGLFVTAQGPLMAGLNPYRSDTRVQVEVLEHGHWHRFATPGLHDRFYSFGWTGNRLVAAFPVGGGSGQSLDPTTGRWTNLAEQPGLNDGGGWWSETSSTYGPRILNRGDLFNTETGRTMRLTQPHGSGPGLSVGLVQRGAYLMDNHSHLWWQHVH